MTYFLKYFRLDHLTSFQKCLWFVSSICMLHYSVGTAMWSFMIYVQTAALFRNCRPGTLWANLMSWIPFYCRIWKAVIPLVLSAIAIGFVRSRPRFSLRIVSLVLGFSVICATYDISCHDHDMSTLKPSSGHMYQYFTWWWHD
jgi:hypothetical protein